MFEPAVTSVFANVNLSLFVYFSSSSKCKYFFLSFEVNFTISTAILSEQLLVSKRVFKKYTKSTKLNIFWHLKGKSFYATFSVKSAQNLGVQLLFMSTYFLSVFGG